MSSENSDAVTGVGKPPPCFSGSEALNELRAKSGYAGDPASLAPFQLDLVSLPPKGSCPASLDRILKGEAENVSDVVVNKVLPEDEVRERLKACGVSRPYYDPLLKSHKRVYAEIV